ncbi:Transposase-associated domain [Sesbania bispinosa]|nr:Transposase-associated domain [Sesbania bispinosa]
MDRKWMRANRLSQEYEDGVKEFIRIAVEHANGKSYILCPCWCCLNNFQVTVEELKEHLICNGIDQLYTCWTKKRVDDVSRLSTNLNA